MDDPRCCGTGTCLINAEGFCWCGQQWDGERMCFPDRPSPAIEPPPPDVAGGGGEGEASA
ncbi:MAG: hypothetical protein KGZ67_15040 [Hydrogenophaga sp.]|jgi:hypothetical protein|nr:hypothetical protein [Hydrogenophaga sp.]